MKTSWKLGVMRGVLPKILDKWIRKYESMPKIQRNGCFTKNLFVVVLFCLLLPQNEATFTNEWAVEIKGGVKEADLVALEHGFINLGRVAPGYDIFHFKHPRVMKRSTMPSDHHHRKLNDHHLVEWADQQYIKKRKKRDLMDNVPFIPSQGPDDPLWHRMWYLLPSSKPTMKVVEAWEIGATGKDVVVTILDDGIEHDHPDLHENYDAMASTDINAPDDDPEPRPTFNNENRHGTRCAGEVAAVANNKVCGSGIAFHSKIGGVRMLDGDVTDMVEFKSISLRPQYIEIYSASWGPDDDGKTVDGPARMAQRGFEDGVKQGRGGLGSIFVWASGNGGKFGDNCNCDGYTNSIYTLSISSVTQHYKVPWYSEACSSTLATTYSSGDNTEAKIVTTDLKGKCTETHTGTSASAPIAAGVCALALEANRNLTWRDMQHIVVQTANPEGLIADDWITNGVGRKVSHSYGYGLLDAKRMVELARTWTTVPEQKMCVIPIISMEATARRFSRNSPLEIPFDVSHCDGGRKMLDKLEHVQAELSIHSDRRGDVIIHLTSPQGTKSMLLGERRGDYTSHPFSDWKFMTTHSWDESPLGLWTLRIEMAPSPIHRSGTLTSYKLILYGTTLHDDNPTPESSESNHMPPTTVSIAAATTNVTATTTTAGSKSPLGIRLQNCQIPSKSGIKCLVCDDNFILEPSGACVLQCPPTYYVVYERIPEKKAQELGNNQKKSAEDAFETAEEEEFEETERLGGQVCRECAFACHMCFGPNNEDCRQCSSGFLLQNHMCVPLVGATTPHAISSWSLQSTVILICVGSIFLFVFLLVFFNLRGRMRGVYQGGAKYETVQNDTDSEDEHFAANKQVRLNGLPPSTSISGYSSVKVYKDNDVA